MHIFSLWFYFVRFVALVSCNIWSILLSCIYIQYFFFLLQRSMWTCHIWIPTRAMNRIVRRKSVAVPWSLFPGELSVGQVLSLFFSVERTRLQDIGYSLCILSAGANADSSMPIFFMWLRSLQWPVISRNIMVCSWRDSRRRESCWGL